MSTNGVAGGEPHRAGGSAEAAFSTIRFTVFRDYAAGSKSEERLGPAALVARIAATTAPSKQELPWLKLAVFGDQRTDKRSLRHDGNVLALTGIEADYDME